MMGGQRLEDEEWDKLLGEPGVILSAELVDKLKVALSRAAKLSNKYGLRGPSDYFTNLQIELGLASSGAGPAPVRQPRPPEEHGTIVLGTNEDPSGVSSMHDDDY